MSVDEPTLPRPIKAPRPLEPVVHDESTILAPGIQQEIASPSRQLNTIPPPRRMGGWIVAATLLLGIGVAGMVIGQKYMQARAQVSSPSQGFGDQVNRPSGDAGLDPRTEQFLLSGERALSDGNLESAKENFDKASALAERHPRVRRALAAYAVTRADLAWWRLRALGSDDTEEVRSTRRELEEYSAKARRAVDDVFSATPEDPEVLRLRVDALRLNEDRTTARTELSKVSTQNERAVGYVTSALEVAEGGALTPQLVSRLRSTAEAAGGGFRARPALVYVLAKMGDVASAREELLKIPAVPSVASLVAALRSMIEKQPHTKPAAIEVTASPATASTAASPATPKAEAMVPGDPRQALQQAEGALRKGDTSRARTLYEAVLSKSPGDSEALAGLGDLSRKERDFTRAQGYYRRALTANPTYLPALIGLGDMQWELGDQATATQTYREILERFPEGTYPARVKQRVEGNAQPSAPPTEATTAPAPSPLPMPESTSSTSDGGETVP